MRLFLDSSVLLSAAGSKKSLSRLLVTVAANHAWELITSAYCGVETARNLTKFESGALEYWKQLESRLIFVPNALTSKRPLLLAASKDKPALISALAAECEVLLTLDRNDFGIVLNTEVYGMLVTTPRDFLLRQGWP